MHNLSTNFGLILNSPTDVTELNFYSEVIRTKYAVLIIFYDNLDACKTLIGSAQAICDKYKDKIKVVTISKNQTKLIQAADITTFPTLLLLRQDPNYIPLIHKGLISLDRLETFIKNGLKKTQYYYE